jgi:hypothetical protein
MKPINYRRQLFITGSIFTIHNLEEAVGFAYFTYPKHLPLPLTPASKPMILSIILITIVGWTTILWTIKRGSHIAAKNVLTAFIGIFLINAVFPHIAGTLVLQQYFPAVVTSVILYLPYSFWALPKLRRLYLLKKHFYIAIIVGLLISILLVILVQVISSSIINL